MTGSIQIDWQEIAAESFAHDLARRLLAGSYDEDALEARVGHAFGEHGRAAQRQLVSDLVKAVPPPDRPGHSTLVDRLLRTRSFRDAFSALYWGSLQWGQSDFAAAIMEQPIARYEATAERIAEALAAKVLASPFEHDRLRAIAADVMGPMTRTDQRRLVAELLRATPEPYPPRPEWLVTWLLSRPAFHRAIARVRRRPDLIHASIDPPRFHPIPRFADLDIPHLATPGDLARWLGVSLGDLDWLAAQRRQHRRTAIPILQHYTYAFIPKRRGPPRLIEQPKPRLATIQRRILHAILVRVPVHDAAYGFVEGRSCIGGAARHVGEAVVIGCDIASFFAAVPARRVHALFRSIGYPWAVARLLTGLVTTTTPANILARAGDQRMHAATLQLYARPHLPQGAPTSPALANLCAWRLDVRLAGLARRFEARYTRYADDITFSGGEDVSAQAGALLRAVGGIAADEGFALNPAKTRVMRRHTRQQVTGIVVNDRLGVSRRDFDALKATLHNAARNGWQAENRTRHPDFRAHLDGRIAWVESLDPRRGARLRLMLAAIDWSPASR